MTPWTVVENKSAVPSGLDIRLPRVYQSVSLAAQAS